MTTTKTLIAASFDVKTAAFDTVLGQARTAIVDVNILVQEAAYSAMYHFIKSFTISNLQRLLDALCVVDGSVDMHRYDSIRTWVNTFFTEAKSKGLMKGNPLSVKKEVNDAGQSELAITWAVDDEGKRRYDLPDASKESTKPASDALLEMLHSYVVTAAIHTAIADKKAADKAAKKAAETANTEALTDAQKLAKDTLAKGKKLESAKTAVTNSFNKAMTTFIENGGNNAELKAHLRTLLETIVVEEVAE